MGTPQTGLGINPYYSLIGLYLFANLLSLLTLSMGSPITIEIEDFIFSSSVVTVSAIALFGALFGSLAVHATASAISKHHHDLRFGSTASWILLLLQLSFLAFNSYYEVNLAGVEDEAQGNALFRLAFSIAQPDLLFLLIATGIRSNRWFWINVFTYGISLLLRSWIGGLYLIAIIVAIRQYPIKISRNNLRLMLGVLIVGVITLPLIVSAKWFFRSGAGISEAFDFLAEVGYLKYLIESLIYVANRFQHLGHVALLAENARSLGEAYETGAFIPYWMDGAPQWFLMRLNGVDIVTFNKFIVRSIFDSTNMAYATNPGVAGWFLVLGQSGLYLAAYLLVVTLIPSILVLRLAGYKYLLLVSCFNLIYLFHGWIGAYFNLVLYLLTLLSVKRLLGSAPAVAGQHSPVVALSVAAERDR